MARVKKTYVPGKNRNKRKHYWWKYLLVFILGQALVLPEVLIGIGTAAASVELGTVLQLAQQNPDDYLTENSKKMTILDLALYFASSANAPKSLNDLNEVIKVKDVIGQLTSSGDLSFLSSILNDDFYATEFSQLGGYFTNSLEIGPILDGFGLSLPSIATDLLYNTPVAYFGKTDSRNIEVVKGDVVELATADFTVLPASASKRGFTITATDESQTSLTFDESKVTVANDASNGIVSLIATPADKTNDTVIDVPFNVEIKDSVQCAEVTPYYDRDNNILIWNNVDHAKAYKVEYPSESGKETSEKLENYIELSKVDNLQDGEIYKVYITTIGKDANHTDSARFEYQFKYEAPVTPQDPQQDPENPDKPDNPQDPSQGKESTRAISRDEQTPENTHVDTSGSYLDGMGNEVSFNHPNGYYDDDKTIIRKGLTISGLGGAFGDIGSLFTSKTIGDLLGMFSGGGSSSPSGEPKIPVIAQIKEATGILDVFQNLKISQLMGGGIMDALGGVSLGMLIENTDDPIMSSLAGYTFGDLTSGNVNIMDSVLKGKTLRELGFVGTNPAGGDGDVTGLLAMIADSCLVNADDYNEPDYDGPTNAIDLFNKLTIGEAMDNKDGDSGNAILDALADIPLQCGDVGGEMTIRLGGGHSDVTNKDYPGTTVGELLNITKGDNAIMDTLINCKLSEDSLTSAMDDLKLSAVIGEDKMFKFEKADMTLQINEQDYLDMYRFHYGEVYSDADCTQPITVYDSLKNYYVNAPSLDGIWTMMFKDFDVCELTFKDEAEFIEFISFIDAFTEKECYNIADTYVEGAKYYTDELYGWQIARRAKVTEMGDLFSKVGSNMLDTSLNELKAQDLLNVAGDLNKPLTIDIDVDYATMGEAIATAATTAQMGSSYHFTYQVDKNGFVSIGKQGNEEAFNDSKGKHNDKLYIYDSSKEEYVESGWVNNQTEYFYAKPLGEYSLNEIISVLANLA